MQNTPSRSRSPRSPLLLLAALFGLPLLALPALAFAQVVGDPLGVATSSADGGISLLVTYGPVVGGMYLAYAWASRILARRAESSALAAWFSRGKRLAIATGTLGIAGAALQAQVTGGPWTVIAMAAVAAFFKLITPTVTAAPTASRSSQVGHARPAMMLGLALAGGLTGLVLYAGCAATKAQIESVAHGAVVCAKADIPAAKALGLQLATEALVSMFAGHGIPWERLASEAEAAAKVQGVAVGSCAFGDLIAELAKLPPPPSWSGSTEAFGAVARTQDPLAAGRRALESLKVRLGITSIDTGAGVF